jgi:hypothetical protein
MTIAEVLVSLKMIKAAVLPGGRQVQGPADPVPDVAVGDLGPDGFLDQPEVVGQGLPDRLILGVVRAGEGVVVAHGVSFFRFLVGSIWSSWPRLVLSRLRA